MPRGRVIGLSVIDGVVSVILTALVFIFLAPNFSQNDDNVSPESAGESEDDSRTGESREVEFPAAPGGTGARWLWRTLVSPRRPLDASGLRLGSRPAKTE